MQAWSGITSWLGQHLVLFSQFQCHSSPLHISHRGPGPFCPSTAFQTVLASHSMNNEIAGPNSTVAIWPNWFRSWSRAGEIETVGNTLGSTLGTPVNWSPLSPSFTLSHLLCQCSIQRAAGAVAQEPGYGVKKGCPLPEFLVLAQLHLWHLHWPAAFLPGQEEDVASRVQRGVSRVTIVYWRPSSLKGRGQWARASPPLAINQEV